MRYLVVSDNHGERDILVDLVARYQSQVDYLLHCGDSELRVDDDLFKNFKVVKGNCDYNPAFLEKQVLNADFDKVLLTHGNNLGVNFGLTRLRLAAEEEGANLAFFGHTHKLGCEYEGQTLFLNPGSISFPRGEFAYLDGTYAIVETSLQTIIVQYYNRKFEPVPELHFEYQR